MRMISLPLKNTNKSRQKLNAPNKDFVNDNKALIQHEIATIEDD